MIKATAANIKKFTRWPLLCSLNTGRAAIRAVLGAVSLAAVCLGSPGWAAEPGERPLAEVGPRPMPVPTPEVEAIDEAIRQGVDFLLERQNKNG